MATRQDLVRRALAVLNADGGAGQEPSAEDYARVDGAVPALLRQLAAEDVIYVASPSEIDDAILEPLARLLAAERAADFGGVRDVAAVELDKDLIRRILAPRWSYSPVRADYF